MSVEQIEESVLKLSNEERRQFVGWFYQHESDLAGPDAYPIHPAIKAGVFHGLGS